MRLKNMRKGPIVGVDLQKRDDDEIVNLGSQTRFVESGEVGIFDPDSRAVKIYAKAGYLKPVDADGKKWLAGL
jgi:hypothetical protein